MKTAIVSQKQLSTTALIVTLAAAFGLGLAAQKGGLDPLAKFEPVIDSLLELPYRIITNLRTVPERVNPIHSECN
jgi:hypothetical protein